MYIDDGDGRELKIGLLLGLILAGIVFGGLV